MKPIARVIRCGLFVASVRALFYYLDPGSGSLIVQILIAVIVGALATFRLWKSRLLSLFGIKQDEDDDDTGGDAESGEVDQV